MADRSPTPQSLFQGMTLTPGTREDASSAWVSNNPLPALSPASDCQRTKLSAWAGRGVAVADVRSLQGDGAVGGVEVRAEEGRLARWSRAGDQRRRKALYSPFQEPGKSAGKQHG